MECQLSGEQIKGLCRAVQCLAKVAHSDYITFLAAPVELSLRGINTAKTAYLVVNFATDYFESFRLSETTCSCSALVKSVLAVFRTAPAAMQRLTITADGKEPDNIRWIIDCQNGVRKTYTIACVNDREVLSASIDPSTYPSSLVARPKPLLQLLNHFQPTLSEITIIAADPDDVSGSGGGAAGGRGGGEAKAVEMRSYLEPTLAASSADGRPQASPEGAMHTQLWVDPGEHFEAYCHRGEAVDVTFSVKEVKAFVQFCESAAADVVMLFHQAGAPLMLMPRFPNPHTNPPRNPRHAHHPQSALASDFDSRLVIATMLESQLPTPPPSDPSVHRASAQPGTPAHEAAAAARGVSAEAAAGARKGGAPRASAEAGTPTVAVSDPYRGYPAGSGRGGGMGEGMGAEGMEGGCGGMDGSGHREAGGAGSEGPLKDAGAGARLDAGWGHAKRWSDLSAQRAKGAVGRAGGDGAEGTGGEGSGAGRRGSNVWPKEQQQRQQQQQQEQQQEEQFQDPANQLPDSEDATEELPIGRMATAARGGTGAGASVGGNAAGSGNVDGNRSAGGDGMSSGGAYAAADLSAGHMPSGASPRPPPQRDPDRWIDNTEEDETEDRSGARAGERLGEDNLEGIGDEDEYVDATPPERRMYDDDDDFVP